MVISSIVSTSYRLRIAAALILFGIAAGYCQTVWKLQNPLNVSTEYYSLAYGGGLFVLVTGNEKIFLSADGTEWIEATNPTSQPLYCITYADNLFVAGGEYGTIITSPDGILWTKRECDKKATMVTVSYGNGLFIMVGSEGGIFTSPDGSSWTTRDCGVTGFLNGVVYGNGIFVVCGDYNSVDTMSVILTSPDGITWTKQYSGVHTTLWPIAFAKNRFLVANNNWYRAAKEGVIVMYSFDGVVWNQVTGMTNYLQDIIYANNRFVSVGRNGTIQTSEDGITWTSRTSGTTKQLTGIAYGNDCFVAAGWGGVILTSPADEKTALQPEPSPVQRAREHFTISVTGKTMRISLPESYLRRNTAIACFTTAGRQLFSHRLTVTGTILNVPFDKIPAGRYIASLDDGTSSLRQMFIIGSSMR
ncbi:MAG: hypothetical protein JW913_07100 [Chitinispirillaceae bacterium]|nr:hypothetical protein [Chitinispirillaceae bacterium]